MNKWYIQAGVVVVCLMCQQLSILTSVLPASFRSAVWGAGHLKTFEDILVGKNHKEVTDHLEKVSEKVSAVTKTNKK